jgi:hypothetical protein
MRVNQLFRTVETHEWPLYQWNLLAAGLHLAQFVVVCVLGADGTEGDVPFTAGRHEVRFTGLAAVNASCAESSGAPVVARHHYYGSWGVSMRWMIAAFFLASALFRWIDGERLRFSPLAPRALHCAESAVSSSLCVAVLALNVGIHDAYALTGVVGLFFGVGLLFACAELLVCLAEGAPHAERDRSAAVVVSAGLEWGLYPLDSWILPHSAAWILFECSWGLVFAQYWIMYRYSERKPPDIVMGCIVLESAAFVGFGLVQHWALSRRRSLLNGPATVYYKLFDLVTWIAFGYFLVDGLVWACDPAPACVRPVVRVCRDMRDCGAKRDVLWYMDAWMIGLGLVARTTLAWLLLGPRLLS